MRDTVTVLSPVPPRALVEERSGPSVDDLDGKVVGLRMDWLWPAYNVAVQEWAERFTERGARVVLYNTREEQDAAALEHRHERTAEVFGGVDLAVVGLGN
jgi:hypothetical protein